MIPGSAFLWNLANWNQRTDDLRGVDAIAVIGNAGSYTPNLSSGSVLSNASDGIVSLTSGSLGFVSEQPSTTRIVPYCHVDPAAFTNTTFGSFACNAAGIANVTDTNQSTGQIVRSFLAGTQAWASIGSTLATDPYLSTDGGMFFGLANTAGAYAADLSAVAWGTVQLQNGGDLDTIFYQDFVAGTGALEATSGSLGTVNCGSYTQAAGYFSAVRCKLNTAIFSIGPLLSTLPRVVSAGSAITITGTNFGSQCVNCKVAATPAGSSTGQTLPVTSWTNTAIAATLPASLTGLLTITVNAVAGSDAMAIMAATPSPSTIALTPGNLQFTYTVGGTVPAAQTVQITNSGSGTLAWTATASASWLSVSPSSGTAASSLSISVSPAALTAGTYNGNIQISSAGASNTPLSLAVTLTVTQAPASLAVTPQALTFNYTAGAAVPAAQSVNVTNGGGGALAWTASASDYWIGLDPVSGSAPGRYRYR